MRLPDITKKQLDELAKATGRSKSFLACEAIKRYVDIEAWQIKQITNALKEADQGHFASSTKVSKVLKKWQKT